MKGPKRLLLGQMEWSYKCFGCDLTPEHGLTGTTAHFINEACS